MKATVEVRKALQSKLEEMIRNEEPVKEVSGREWLNLWNTWIRTGLLLIFAMWNVLQVEWLHNFETVNALSELWKLEWWIYPEIWVMLPLSGHIFVDTSYHEAADILCYNCNFLGYHIMSDFQYRVFKKMKMPLNRTILLLKHTHGSWLF